MAGGHTQVTLTTIQGHFPTPPVYPDLYDRMADIKQSIVMMHDALGWSRAVCRHSGHREPLATCEPSYHLDPGEDQVWQNY